MNPPASFGQFGVGLRGHGRDASNGRVLSWIGRERAPRLCYPSWQPAGSSFKGKFGKLTGPVGPRTRRERRAYYSDHSQCRPAVHGGWAFPTVAQPGGCHRRAESSAARPVSVSSALARLRATHVPESSRRSAAALPSRDGPTFAAFAGWPSFATLECGGGRPSHRPPCAAWSPLRDEEEGSRLVAEGVPRHRLAWLSLAAGPLLRRQLDASRWLVDGDHLDSQQLVADLAHLVDLADVLVVEPR